MKKSLKITLIIIGAVVILLAAAAFFAPKIIAEAVYKDNFGKRFESYEPTLRSLDEFEGLMCREYSFASDKGQQLAGYCYYRTETPKGLIVIAHGFGGGGHNSYMDVADWFASEDYAVFAYDATGCDASEGEVLGGMPQGVIDLDYALRFVKGNEDFAGLPIMLWGHSWGAYSVGSVLAYHSDVKAAVMVAGFDTSADIFEYQGRQTVGDAVDFIIPYVSEIEEKKFGEYASASCMAGFEATDAAVMILHSRDDNVVSVGIGYDRFYEKYGSDPRFKFISFEDRGHVSVYYSENINAYIDEFNAAFDEYIAGLDGGFTPEAKAEYLTEHLDKAKRYELDTDVMREMTEFYNSRLD